jgi:hypothetical protein
VDGHGRLGFWDYGSGKSPRRRHAGLASGVRELHGGHAAVGANEFRDAGERRDVRVAPDAEVAGSDAAFGRNGSGFSEHDARSADSAAAKVYEVPVIGEAID